MFEALQAAGIETIKIGKKEYSLEKPKTKDRIEGFGDTIKVGDVFFEKVDEKTKGNHNKRDVISDDLVGPFKLLAVSADDNHPWFRYMTSDRSEPSGLYFFNDSSRKFPGWRREFKLADEQSTKRLNDALKYCDLYVRVYVNFNNGIPNRPILIPASWIVWEGDFLKACRTYGRPFGQLKKKNIVKWVKNKMFKSLRMDSKVPIPDDFPIDIS